MSVGGGLFVFGHGSGRTGDELNSRASFVQLRHSGVDGVELDVRRTADDVLVARHDPTLDDGRLLSVVPFAEMPADTVTLADALDLCVGRLVNIEIKSYPQDVDYRADERVTDLVVELLAARGWTDRVLISSFGLPCLERVRSLAPTLPRAFLLYRAGDHERLDAVVDAQHRIVHPYEPHVDEQFMRAARERDLEVNVWTMRDEPATIERLLDLGVDGIITGRPEVALAARAARQG